jgi:hypothetical protein
LPVKTQETPPRPTPPGTGLQIPQSAIRIPQLSAPTIWTNDHAPPTRIHMCIGTSCRVNERFFEIISKEEKIAYIPTSQLLRIEASPQGGIFLNFSESFQVNVEVADGAELATVKSLYEDLISASPEPIRLNTQILNITHIHF